MARIPTRSNRVIVNRGVIAETGVVPPGLQLIRDVWSFQPIDTKMTVNEDKNGEVPVMRVTGLFQMGDKENANQRYYPTSDVLAPAVRNIQEDVQNRAVMGEFDHPADAKIHLSNVSHLITKIWMEGKKVFGEAEILHKLPSGSYLRGLFEHKVRVGISSRGVGDMEVVENNGQQIYRVMPGYTFVTWDAVAEPSVNGAILHIREGVERKIRPIKESAKKNPSRFTPGLYNNLVVNAINEYFGLK